jgi:hypothetical protein
MTTSPRATGAPHSARAVKVPSRETWAICVSPRNPSDADANARASRGRVGVDALSGRMP